MLNSAIGESVRFNNIMCNKPFSIIFFCSCSVLKVSAQMASSVSGTYTKPYVALIDGITMGGVSIHWHDVLKL